MMRRMHVGQSSNKRALLDELLGLGMVLVAIDARGKGVDVPSHLVGDPQLRLNLSYRFGLPMAMDEWGVCATLTFGGMPHACRFAWPSIFLMVSHVNGEPYLFPDDVPEELLHKNNGQFRLREAIVPSRPCRPHLSVVGFVDPKASATTSATPPTKATGTQPPSQRAVSAPKGGKKAPRSRGHLRVVK